MSYPATKMQGKIYEKGDVKTSGEYLWLNGISERFNGMGF